MRDATIKERGQAFLEALIELENEHDVHLHATEWLTVVMGPRPAPLLLGSYDGNDAVQVECDDFG
jgi:hypothetical protein